MIETSSAYLEGDEIAVVTDGDGDRWRAMRASSLRLSDVVFFESSIGVYLTAADVRGLIEALEPFATPKAEQLDHEPIEPGSSLLVGDRVRHLLLSTPGKSEGVIVGRVGGDGIPGQVPVRWDDAVVCSALPRNLVRIPAPEPERPEANEVTSWGRIEAAPAPTPTEPSPLDPRRVAAVEKAAELLEGAALPDVVELARFLLDEPKTETPAPWLTYHTTGAQR